MMNDEANRTRGGFQGGGLDPNQQTNQQPTGQGPTTTGQQFQQQQNTNTQPQMGPDPAYTQQQQTFWQPGFSTNANANRIRQLVPQLAHMSDEYLLAQPCDAIYRLSREEKQAETSKAAKGLEVKLHNNFKKATENPIFVSGYDNRSNTLHPARFLPGAGVPIQNLWLEARKQWGQEGVEPIGNYDLEALGCSGCVTARGWEQLHKPGSPEISLKMFTVSNIGHLASSTRTVSLVGEDGIEIHDNLKEFADIAEFKQAVRNLRLAAQLATPWNMSFAVIDGFLQANDYMEGKLEGSKKATVLTAFFDHVMKVNAGLWVQEAPFLDNAKLMALWNSWWATRRVKAKADGDQQAKSQNNSNSNYGKGKYNNNKQQNQNHGKGNNQNGQNWGTGYGQQGNGQSWGGQAGPQGGRQGWGGPPWGGQNLRPNGPPSETNICRRFNEKGCMHQWFNCVLATKSGPIKLYHLCNLMVKKDGGKSELCLGKHPRVDHKEN
jgi:hypothetical protein